MKLKNAQPIQVSVIIPVFGDFDKQITKIALYSILNQKGCELEVIVVTDNCRFFKDFSCRCVEIPKWAANPTAYNLGAIRNMGAVSSCGERLYFSDGDIIFKDETFLARSVKKLGNSSALIRPRMRRLPIYEKEFLKNQIHRISAQALIESLTESGEYFIQLSDKEYNYYTYSKYDTIERHRRNFTAISDDYKLFHERMWSHPEENCWPCYWIEDKHCGGLLLKREQFFDVGGYSDNFQNWGCEDTYLIWKLESVTTLRLFPNSLEVVHVDHKRTHIRPTDWCKNEKRFEMLRSKVGLQKCISRDLKKLRSNYA